MRVVLTATVLALAYASLSDAPAPQVDATPAPVVIDNSAEVAALKAEVESLRAEIASLKSVLSQRQVVPSRPEPVAVKPPAATGGPVAYYQRRAVYGRFGRFQGYQTVLVTSQPQAQQTYAAGDCANGNCSTGRGLFGRRQ